MGQGWREQAVALDLGKADLIEVAPEQARRPATQSRRVQSSAPSELIALVFSRDRQGPEEGRLREALALTIDRAALNSVLLQGGGEPAGGFLPNWMTGYAFVFPSGVDLARAKQVRGELRQSSPWTLAYDAADPVARVMAERIALNARDAGLQVQPTNSSATDLRLVRLPLISLDPDIALTSLESGLGLPQSKLSGTSLDELYGAESMLLQSQRVIPLLHVRVSYAMNAGVRNWSQSSTGAWRLGDIWLDAEESRELSPQTAGRIRAHSISVSGGGDRNRIVGHPPGFSAGGRRTGDGSRGAISPRVQPSWRRGGAPCAVHRRQRRARPNGAASRGSPDYGAFLNVAKNIAADQQLDFLEFVDSEGTIISSAQWPAKFGYPEPTFRADVPEAFLQQETLPEGAALGLSACANQAGRQAGLCDRRAPPRQGFSWPAWSFRRGPGRCCTRIWAADFPLRFDRSVRLWRISPNGSRRSFSRCSNAAAEGARCIHWSSDPLDDESVHAIPLSGQDNQLLGILAGGQFAPVLYRIAAPYPHGGVAGRGGWNSARHHFSADGRRGA